MLNGKHISNPITAGLQIKYILKYFAGSNAPISVLEPAETNGLFLLHKRVSETKGKNM